MKTDSYQRVNITLPKKTLQRVDRISPHGNRSRFVDTAINFYIAKLGRKQLEQAIKEEAIRWRERDLKIAEEMLDLGDLWEY